MSKFYRRFIRIGQDLISSPRFTKKSDAETWYHEMRRKKQFLRDGVQLKADKNGTPFIDFARRWMKQRIKDYPQATWSADNQRLRDYILPFLSEIPIGSIDGPIVRNLLVKISEDGYLKDNFTISAATRDRVKALLSAIFSDALNENPPLVVFNPVHGIKIKERRKGKAKPRTLSGAAECIRFLSAAKELGETHFLVSNIFLMSGVRKQELIALRWNSFLSKSNELEVSEKYEQASNSIKSGTKGGEDSTRKIPISKELSLLLRSHHKTAKFSAPTDFIVCRPDGEFYGPKEIWNIINEVRTAAKLDISPHGLRHTFGREFAANTGNIKALQSILGHTSSSTTDIYSELAGNRIKGFSEAVSYRIGVKESEE